jgi:hypothetical protein
MSLVIKTTQSDTSSRTTMMTIGRHAAEETEAGSKISTANSQQNYDIHP